MFLLDTSALVAHFLREPGSDMVAAMLEGNHAYVAAVSWLEFREILNSKAASAELLDIYMGCVAGTVDVTSAVAESAHEIKKACAKRLPNLDALIAGAARTRGFRLIHRDSHFRAIPARLLAQEMLPAK